MVQRNKRNLIHEIYVCLNDSERNLFQLNTYLNIFLGLKMSAHSSVSLRIISPLPEVKTLGIASFSQNVGVFPFQLPLHGESVPGLHCLWHIPQGPASQSPNPSSSHLAPLNPIHNLTLLRGLSQTQNPKKLSIG